MRKTALMVSVFLVFSFLIMLGITPCWIVKANFDPRAFFPDEPVITPPAVIVTSPYPEKNYDSTTLLLNFTINKPDSWVYPLYDSLHMVVGRIVAYYYVLDGVRSQNFSVDEKFGVISDRGSFEMTRNFTQGLTATKGSHNISITLDCETTWRGDGKEAYVSFVASSKVVNFTVLQEPLQIVTGFLQENFPTTIAVAFGTSIAVISLALLVYMMKRRRLTVTRK